MRFEFTVSAPDGDCDVAVDTPIIVRLDEVRARLLAAIGARPDAALRGAEPHAELGSAGVRTGSVLTLGPRPVARPAAPPDRRTLTARVVGGRDAGTVVPLAPGDNGIGRAAHCRVALRDDAVSREHALLSVGPSGVTVRDLGSTNGTAVDGVPAPRSGGPVGPGDVVRVGDTLLALDERRPAALSLRRAGDRCLVTLPARERLAPGDAVIDVGAAPARPGHRPVQWLAAVLPAVAGGLLAWVARSPVFLLFALLSPVMLLGTALGDRVHGRRDRRRGRVEAGLRRTRDEQAVRQALRDETVAFRARFPDATTIAAAAAVPTSRLWERRLPDPDVLRLRLGSADVPSRTAVRCDGVQRSAAVLPAVPLVVDLRAGPLGLVGPAGAVSGVARSLVAQLAVLHAPSCVELAVVVADPGRDAEWRWTRWLPHVAGRSACDPAARRRLADELSRSAALAAGTTGPERPVTVAVLDLVGVDDDGVDDGGVDLSDAAQRGLSAVVLAETAARIPAWCTRVVDVTRPDTAADVGDGGGGARRVVIDEVRLDWAEGVARALAPLVESSPSAGAVLPSSCHLLDVAGLRGPAPDEVLDRWAADDGGARAVVGTGPDGPFELDLVRDGPHALVAGTTGSGKSELLRSLVLGLALTHPPDAVNFVLIDYKGGAAFADCAGLPHVVGSVTDLDPHLTRRALASLDAELRRRERLFADAAAGDLEGYREHRRAVAVPRLVIVVDEFAALADELPDFLRGVVSVAQRGRSLGVHLVLATQRPGSAVTAEIRANTALRIALRVVDAAESHEIVAGPEAAAIAPTLPGRAVVRVGGSTVTVQTACTDRVPRANTGAVTIERLGPWRRRDTRADPAGERDSARVVGAVAAAARSRGVAAGPGPWRPPLPDAIDAGTLHVGAPGRLAVGLVDLPGEQRQATLELDPARPSSWLVVGAPRSGRTTALATIALGASAACTPAELELYVLDGDGALATVLDGLPHVATCLGPDGLAHAPLLLRRLAERPVGPARTVLLLDHAERLLVGDDDLPAVSTSALAELRRRTGACVVVAGSRALLAGRLAGGFDQRFVLRLSDRADYSLAGLAPRDVPSRLPPGRAVRVSDGVEVQLGFRGTAPGTGSARELARRLTRRTTGAPSAGAVRLRPLPVGVRLTDLPARPARLRLGLAGESASAVGVDPFTGSRQWSVAGPARSGRTTALLTLLAEAVRTGTPVLVAAPPRSPLHTRAAELGVTMAPDGSGVEAPRVPTLVLVDDVEAVTDTALGDRLTTWCTDATLPLSFVVAGRSDELAASYTGLGAAVRRSRCGLLLQPGPLDGELFGVRLPRCDGLPPGRGLLVGARDWLAGTPEADGADPVAIQVARP